MVSPKSVKALKRNWNEMFWDQRIGRNNRQAVKWKINNKQAEKTDNRKTDRQADKKSSTNNRQANKQIIKKAEKHTSDKQKK